MKIEIQIRNLLFLLFALTMNSFISFSQAPEKTEPYTYLALGDSYTIGEGVPEGGRFPVHLTKRLFTEGVQISDAQIIAKTGWTTDELQKGILNQELKKPYNLITLLIGVNNQYRGRDTFEYRQQFRELLHTAIELAGNSAKKVIVVSTPDYGVTPFATTKNPQKIAREIDDFNATNKAETAKAGAYYIDITPISKKAKNNTGLLAEDQLHPSAKMYAQWVDLIIPVAKQILIQQH